MGDPGIPLDLSSRLNQRRRDLGFSTGDLARVAGLSRSHMEALMSGKRTPTVPVSEKLIAALRLDSDFADELRTLTESRYKSGFAQGPIRLTREG